MFKEYASITFLYILKKYLPGWFDKFHILNTTLHERVSVSVKSLSPGFVNLSLCLPDK